jgi:hypothetical protein
MEGTDERAGDGGRLGNGRPFPINGVFSVGDALGSQGEQCDPCAISILTIKLINNKNTNKKLGTEKQRAPTYKRYGVFSSPIQKVVKTEKGMWSFFFSKLSTNKNYKRRKRNVKMSWSGCDWSR